MAASGIFGTMPEGFFSPLARANREHYAALLVALLAIAALAVVVTSRRRRQGAHAA